MSRRPARTRPTRAQTRERIMDGALDAFAERGFQGASQEDICERVGLSRGAYNSSFQSKEELFFALYDRIIERLQVRLEASMTEALLASGPVIDNFVKAFVSNYSFDRKWYLLQAEFRLHALRNPAVASHYAARQARILTVIEHAIARVGEQKKPVGPGKLSRMARMLLAVHEGGMFQGLLEPTEIAGGELLEFFGTLVMARALAAN